MEKPILFNTEMVKAIWEGRKTTTRRLVKGNVQKLNIIGSSSSDGVNFNYVSFGYGNINDINSVNIKERVKAPYLPGDILYVRETWMISNPFGDFAKDNRTAEYMYKAGYAKGKRIAITREMEKKLGAWKPSIHMPKVAARIFLKVTGIRAEKLQDITENQIRQEGIKEEFPPLAQDEFRDLWNSTLKKEQLKIYGWNANPYVWVIEFEVIKK
ncbi:MAG: hypothetical protein LLF98_11645 [Clostridium sp.]|uniref:hypothetical protein n=1 Tax=Clostridium sp. TaxID=1506 RepID=UPI0025BE0E30|nr:hypothetical protein [Clostridium sp.]MCE5221882.1 hypothetical protein [Clostridium sp.]